MTAPQASTGTTSWRATLAVAGFALAVRVLLLAVTFQLVPVDMGRIAELHDGREYLQVAAALGSAEADAALPRPAQRLSPGYPILIRAASRLWPPAWAAVLLALFGAAAAAALLTRLGLSPWAAALFAVLTPSWVAFSASAMSEGPFLALALLGLLAWRRGRPAAAGLAFGAATLVRPVGAVIFAALWWVQGTQRPTEDGARRRWIPELRGGLPAVAAFSVAPLLWTGWALAFQGGPSSLATYARRDGAWPLTSLLAGLADPLADPGKALQNLFVLAVVAAAAWGLGRRLRRRDAGAGPRLEDRQWFWWLAAQTVFYVLLPSHWVFQSLPRFLVTDLPAVAFAADGAARSSSRLTRGLVLAGFTVFAVAVCLYWNLRALGRF